MIGEAGEAATMWCAECERSVEPTTTYAMSPLGGSLVTLQRCPVCESQLSTPPSHPTRTTGVFEGGWPFRVDRDSDRRDT